MSKPLTDNIALIDGIVSSLKPVDSISMQSIARYFAENLEERRDLERFHTAFANEIRRRYEDNEVIK